MTSTRQRPPVVSDAAPDFVKRVTGVILANHGDRLPVSAFPVDGTWPMGTTRWEKRNIATEIPVWDSSLCIQCNKCALVCPHAAIRAKVYEPERLEGAPGTFQSMARHGALTPAQILVAMVTITLFIPCIANFFMIVKERGWKTALAIAGFITPFALGVGAALNFLLRLAPGIVR